MTAMNVFWLLVVIAFFVFAFMWTQKTNEWDREKEKEEKFGGFNREHNEKEIKALDKLRREKDMIPVFESVGLYIEKEKELPSGEIEIEKEYPKKVNESATSTGFRFVYSLPTKMTGKMWEEKLLSAGDLFPDDEIEWQPVAGNVGRGEIIIRTRIGGEGDVSLGLLD